MSIAEAVQSAIKQCGREITLTRGSHTDRFFACIQPRAYDHQTSGRPDKSAFGQVDAHEFVYYGPLSGGGERVREGVELRVDTERYSVGLCHDFYCCGDRLFRWAALRRLSTGDDI